MLFKIGFNRSGSLFVDKVQPEEDVNDAYLVLNRERLVQLQQSANFALTHHQPPNKAIQAERPSEALSDDLDWAEQHTLLGRI